MARTYNVDTEEYNDPVYRNLLITAADETCLEQTLDEKNPFEVIVFQVPDLATGKNPSEGRLSANSFFENEDATNCPNTVELVFADGEGENVI